MKTYDLRMMFKINDDELNILDTLMKKTRMRQSATLDVAIEILFNLLNKLNLDELTEEKKIKFDKGRTYRVSEEGRERINAIRKNVGLNQSVILYTALEVMLKQIEQGKTIQELTDQGLFL